MTKNNQHKSGSEVFVPLNKLKKSPRNVRKVPHGVSEIEALAASIAANGMMQNLVIEPEHDDAGFETGNYLVTIGEGRRLAQCLRAQRKQIKKTEPIRCILDTEHDAHEISLAENVVRSPMHPADEYEAFALLHNDKGMAAEDIAARFGVTPAVVRQRLRLGAVSPALMAHYRAGDMTLEQLMAFTITDDHARQEEVWGALGYDDSAYAIRRVLTEGQVKSDDRRAKFIGAEAYAEAGGLIIQDLFDQPGGGYFADPALLDRLVIQKLERKAESVRAEGWAWVSVALEFDHALVSDMRREYPNEPALSAKTQRKLDKLAQQYDALSEAVESGEGNDDIEAQLAELDTAMQALKGEPVFAPDVIAKGGALVSLGYDGTVRIERGFIKAADQPKTKSSANADRQDDDRFGPGLSDRLVADLTARRTAALREALATHPDIAFLSVVHVLAEKTFYMASHVSCLELSPRTLELSKFAPGIDESAEAHANNERHGAWAAKMPDSVEDLWETLQAFTQEQLMSLMAHCAALTIDCVVRPGFGSSEIEKQVEKLAQAASLDMRTHWQPTVASYFGQVTKPMILEAVCEATGEKDVTRLANLKKPAMAEAAEKLLINSGWLPSVLRPAAAGSSAAA